jgi:hypothetical protein
MHMYPHLHAYVSTLTCICIHTYMHMYPHLHAYVSTLTCTHNHTSYREHILLNHTCIHIYVSTYKYQYPHLHTSYREHILLTSFNPMENTFYTQAVSTLTYTHNQSRARALYVYISLFPSLPLSPPLSHTGTWTHTYESMVDGGCAHEDSAKILKTFSKSWLCIVNIL